MHLFFLSSLQTTQFKRFITFQVCAGETLQKRLFQKLIFQFQYIYTHRSIVKYCQGSRKSVKSQGILSKVWEKILNFKKSSAILELRF